MSKNSQVKILERGGQPYLKYGSDLVDISWDFHFRINFKDHKNDLKIDIQTCFESKGNFLKPKYVIRKHTPISRITSFWDQVQTGFFFLFLVEHVFVCVGFATGEEKRLLT